MFADLIATLRRAGKSGRATAVADAVASPGASWEKLERQDWHLWALTILLMLVLGVSLLSFMFPTVYWFGGELAVRSPQRAFVGFCILLALTLAYLIHRQATVRRLKRRLYMAQLQAAKAEDRAAVECLQALPALAEFRDVLAMEYRRAATAGGRLACVLATFNEARPEKLGRAVRRIQAMLRSGEHLFHISGASFAAMLPGMPPDQAAAFGQKIADNMGVEAGEPQIRWIVYPDETHSLAEIERQLWSSIQDAGS